MADHSLDAEIIGRAVLSGLNLVDRKQFARVLEELNLSYVEADQWYPFQAYLDFLDAVMKHGGAMANLVSLGMDIAATVPFPPEFSSLPLADVLSLVQQGYYDDHRGSQVGSIESKLVSERHFRFIFRTPYLDDFFYGVCYGLVRRYAPAGTQFSVTYDDAVVRRDLGGERTIIDIT